MLHRISEELLMENSMCLTNQTEFRVSRDGKAQYKSKLLSFVLSGVEVIKYSQTSSKINTEINSIWLARLGE